MKAEHKIWWEALADQYEAWAEKPPLFFSGREKYTCFELEYVLGFNHITFTIIEMTSLLFDFCGYADLRYPAGSIYDEDRATKREAFCQDMADTIRENIR